LDNTVGMNELDDYDYELPTSLIAAHPAPRREDARLLVLHRATGKIEHRGVRDLPQLLSPGDCLVMNDTRVVPARLLGERTATGGRWEGLFLNTAGPRHWRLIGQTRGKLQPGEQLTLFPAGHDAATATDRLQLTLIERLPEGEWLVRVESDRPPFELLDQFGTIPLPPYIERDIATEEDRERYQTLYARRPGAVAAPTAGLHLTPELLAACRARGVDEDYVTLHVGIGTFRPISASRLDEHRMHAEWCEVNTACAERLQQVRERGGRIIAVGTTTARTLETASSSGELRPWSGETRIFIRPPYSFRSLDVLLTNFHLPRSTLLVMLSAFAGREQVLEAYRVAVAEKYRFYSYGDAMLIL